MKYLFILFLFFLILVLAFGFSVIRFIFRLLFGGWTNKNTTQQSHQSSKKQQNKTNYRGTRHNYPKVFSKEEGEYVDYEEIK